MHHYAIINRDGIVIARCLDQGHAARFAAREVPSADVERVEGGINDCRTWSPPKKRWWQRWKEKP